MTEKIVGFLLAIVLPASLAYGAYKETNSIYFPLLGFLICFLIVLAHGGVVEEFNKIKEKLNWIHKHLDK